MIPHGELRSRSHTISSFAYRASKLIGFAPFAFYLIAADYCCRDGVFAMLGTTNDKRLSRGKSFFDRSTM